MTTNLVTNPGAESGTTSGWDTTNWYATTTTPHSGNYDFYTGAISSVSMSQTISLIVGITYEVSLWVKCADDFGINTGDDCVLNLNIDNSNLISLSSSASTITSEYTYHYAIFTANYSSITLQINGYSPLAYVYIDDIAIIKDISNNVVTNIELAKLASSQGITITNTGTDSSIGKSLASAGDFNGDGIADIIIGSPKENYEAGATYIIYGKNSGLSNIDLASLTPDQGIKISGANPVDYIGFSVASAGDFNGDGLDDVIIGAPTVNNFYGVTYIIYGNKTSLANIELASLITPDQGIVISGAISFGHSGFSVASAGDVNGDDLDDIIIGAPYAYNLAGATYIIYGKNSSLSNVDLASLTPDQGIIIQGAVQRAQSGFSVASAGDFDGDGLDDIIIGAPYAYNLAGAFYVIYGGKNLVNISLDSVSESQGVFLFGASYNQLGWSVASVCSFKSNNAILVGANKANLGSGVSYVYNKDYFLDEHSYYYDDNSDYGLIVGSNYFDESGYSVASAGDVDGDGNNDIIIGAPFATNNAGKSYVLYGGSGTINYDLSAITSGQGIIVTGKSGSKSGWSVASAGDVNGDGLDDIIIGAPYDNDNKGEVYLLYGARSGLETPSPTSEIIPSPEVTPSPTITWYNTIEFKLGFSLGTPALSFIFGWLFREKIAFHILSNWGYSYKLLYNDDHLIMDNKEVGFILKSSSGKLACVIKGKAIKIEIDNGNNNGLPKGLFDTIVQNLKQQPQIDQFTFMQSEKNKIRDFLESASLVNYQDLGFIRGNLYKACLQTSYRRKHNEKYQFEVRSNDYQRSSDIDEGIELGTSNPIIADGKHTTLYAVHGIHYANPILNHPKSNEILNYAKEVGGIKAANILLDLKTSQILTEDLSQMKLCEIKGVIKEIFSAGKVDNEVLELAKEATFVSDTTAINYLNLIGNLQQLIEAYPLINYLSNNIVYPLVQNYLPESLQNITLPEISNAMLVTAHMSIGHLYAWQQPQTSIPFYIVESVAKSSSFAARLGVTKFINDYRDELEQNEQTITTSEAIKHCVSTILTYTVPDLLICAVAKATMPGYECSDMNLGAKVSFAGSECYAVYKSSQEPIKPTTADVVVPYIADLAAGIAVYANGYGLMVVISSVLTADWMSKISMEMLPQEVKEEYVDPAIEYAAEICAYSIDAIYQMLGTTQDL